MAARNLYSRAPHASVGEDQAHPPERLTHHGASSFVRVISGRTSQSDGIDLSHCCALSWRRLFASGLPVVVVRAFSRRCAGDLRPLKSNATTAQVKIAKSVMMSIFPTAQFPGWFAFADLP
jgi:hypothetical protein